MVAWVLNHPEFNLRGRVPGCVFIRAHSRVAGLFRNIFRRCDALLCELYFDVGDANALEILHRLKHLRGDEERAELKGWYAVLLFDAFLPNRDELARLVA